MSNTTDNKYTYSIEMFKNVGTEENPVFDWVKDIRVYKQEKQLTDDDLKDIPNKRRNAKLVSIEINGAIIIPEKIDMSNYNSDAYNEALKSFITN